jgi:hypothetical protein
MRKLIEYTLVSVDGVCESPQSWGAMHFRDDAYMRDGLGLLLAYDTMLMGRRTYESFAKMWLGRAHPWADRINAIQKVVKGKHKAVNDGPYDGPFAEKDVVGGYIAVEIAKGCPILEVGGSVEVRPIQKVTM